MDLSVVIPAYNQREQLTALLDSLTGFEENIESIVVNGPSTDGTSGMLRARDDVDCVLETASRNINVARNAGLREAQSDRIALISPTFEISDTWVTAIVESLRGENDVVSGPIVPDRVGEDKRRVVDDDTHLQINGENVAFTRSAITALDGFDEFLVIDGAVDLSQRVHQQGLQLVWHPDMRVFDRHADIDEPIHNGSLDPASWQEHANPGWGVIYRSRAYLQTKNNGIGPRVLSTIIKSALVDGAIAAREVARGNASPTSWIGNGVAVVQNVVIGIKKGREARNADRTPARNPHGMSQSDDTNIVDRYDRRETTLS